MTSTELDSGDSDVMRDNDAEIPADNALDDSLGQEIDLTLVHKYDSNTTISAGYSHYFTSDSFGKLNQAGATTTRTAENASTFNADSDWAYVMVDTKF